MDIEVIIDRSRILSNAMMSDPNRPTWQTEICIILDSLVGIVDCLDSDLSEMESVLDSYKRDLKRVEERYSELQYKYAELKASDKSA